MATSPRNQQSRKERLNDRADELLLLSHEPSLVERFGIRAQLVFTVVVALVAFTLSLGYGAVRGISVSLASERRENTLAVANYWATRADADAESELFRAQVEDGFRTLISGGIVDRVSVHSPSLELPSLLCSVGEKAQICVQPHIIDTSRLINALWFFIAVASLAVTFLVLFVFTRSLVWPIESVARVASRLAEGDLTARVPLSGAREITLLGLTFNRMADQLRRKREELEQHIERLETLTVELNQMQASLVRSEKLASVGKLAAGVAHEIGNPLTAIAGLIDLNLQVELEPEQRRDFLQRAHNECERMQAIIRQLLDFSRQEASAQDLGSSRLQVAVDAAVGLLEPQPEWSRVRIERHMPDDLPKAMGSSERWTQVFLNLLLNAADAMHKEGRITVTLRARGGRLEAIVDDTGPGIAPEDRNRVFDPFFTTKSVGHGTGLGLSVCHRLVSEVGGNILVESSPSGARFVLQIPIAGSSSASMETISSS